MPRAVPLLLLLIAVVIALTGCPPTEEGFDTELRFITPGNQDVFGQLDRLEVTFYYAGEEPLGFVLDAPFPDEQPLDDLPRADAGEVHLEVRGSVEDTTAADGWRLAAVGEADDFALPADEPITVFLAMRRQLAQLNTRLQHPRGDASGFELEDGRVVIFGGVDGSTTVPAIEVLHPDELEQYTISEGGAFPRVAHGVATIEGSDTQYDGHTVVMGGDGACGDFLCATSTAPAYDLSYFKSGAIEFEEVFSQSLTFLGAEYLQLPGGRVGIVAGVDKNGSYSQRPYLFEPAEEVIVTSTPNESIDGREQTSATVMDPVTGAVLVVGGIAADLMDDAVIWTPDVSSVPATGTLNEARMRHTATRLPDNRVLIVGGAVASMWNAPGTAIGSIETFNPSSETFSLENAVLTWPRMRHIAVLVEDEDNSVLICGGATSLEGPPVSACERYQPGDASISILDGAPLAPGGEGMGHVVLADGRVLLFGGLADGAPLDDIYLYTP